MHVRTRTGRPRKDGAGLFLALGLALGSAGASCAESSAADRAGAATAALAPYQSELLDLASDAAGAIPPQPHIKTRSRAQEEVVVACFELDQPERALAYLERIDNWRKGTAYADCAYYLATHGREDEAPRYVELARQVAQAHAEDENAQEWRTDRIRAKIARVELTLGHEERAASLAAGAEPSEARLLETTRAAQVDAGGLDQRLEELRAVAAAGVFDELRHAMAAYVELYGRFYGDAERRARVDADLRKCWIKMPVTLRVEWTAGLADAALAHGDAAGAGALLAEARELLDAAPLGVEFRLPLAARLAALEHRAGERGAARVRLDALVEDYDQARVRLPSADRADLLRPLAEALAAVGDASAALVIYRRAVEDGAENPNALPRAEDLVATCRSMAIARVEPDAALAARLREVRGGLLEPW